MPVLQPAVKASDHPDPEPRGAARRGVVSAVVALAAVALGGYFGWGEYLVWRAARRVRAAMAARQFAGAREPLQRWLAASRSSAEAHYYQARLALADND